MPKKAKLDSNLKALDIRKDDEESFEATIEVVSDIQSKPLNPAGRLVAYAEFTQDGKSYEPGDVFTPPAGWARDAAYDEFRGIQVKNKAGKEIGTAFNTPQGLQIVPVKEA